MDGTSFGSLRLVPAPDPPAAADPPPAPAPVRPDPHRLGNLELIRPHAAARGAHPLEPYSPAWYDEVAQKRYARHGSWLPTALEFTRHPGESVLVLGPGAGSDAVRYAAGGCEVTVGLTPTDYPDVVRGNLDRRGCSAKLVPITGPTLPFLDGQFDVVCLNGLHFPPPDLGTLTGELYRVLKANGKVIGLFPAKFDCGFWQDLLLPLQYLYWRRPPDPTSAPKTTAKDLRRAFHRFTGHWTCKRHLRRSELPHLWRVLPLGVLERLIGRVLVLKAFKPITARTGSHQPLHVPLDVYRAA